MISPASAAAVVVAFLVIFAVLLPIFEMSKKIRKIVSLRWCVVVFTLALALAAVLDFSHLDDDVRLAIVIGAMATGLVFVFLRTFEKAAARGWTLPTIRFRRGDSEGSIGGAPPEQKKGGEE